MEEHWVRTSDGYELQVFRIPRPAARRGSVLLLHGLLVRPSRLSSYPLSCTASLCAPCLIYMFSGTASCRRRRWRCCLFMLRLRIAPWRSPLSRRRLLLREERWPR